MIKKKIPSKLYHYCSIESFFHIVQSQSLWLSNSDQMNDSHENIWIEKHFEMVRDYFKDSKYEKLLTEGFEIYKSNKNPPYIFCLSAIKDLLSQWRAYSRDGQGVAIGFQTKYIGISQKLAQANRDMTNTLGLLKVEYLTSEQKKIILSFCNDIKTIHDFKNPQEDHFPLLKVHLGMSLVNYAAIFKNYNFKEEHEWRIIHTPSEKYDKKIANLSDINFRTNSDRILTYFSYNFFDSFNSSLIPEIILGPKCKITITEMNQFLRHHNLGKTKVYESKSSYR